MMMIDNLFRKKVKISKAKELKKAPLEDGNDALHLRFPSYTIDNVFTKNVKIAKVKGLKDAPLEDDNNDTLGFRSYAIALSDFILTTDTPMTIGIQGDWGSGKSSMMSLVEKITKKLCKEDGKKLHTLWFNTWQFSQFNMGDRLSMSLLYRFIGDMEKLGTDSTQPKKSKFLSWMTGGRYGAKKSIKRSKANKTLNLIMTGAVEIAGARDAARKLREPSENIAYLQKELIKLVKEKRESNQIDRIVVFIDDIDRLIPEKAVELLEALKLFLDIEGCVYVLACDYQVIAQGLKQKFGVDESTLKNRSFFDKIIQVPFNMPVNQYDVHKFCEQMLQHIGVAHDEADVALYVNLISFSVGFNPRTVKRLFNNLLLLKLVFDFKKDKKEKIAQSNEKMRILFATLCLQNTFAPIYYHLQEHLKHVCKQIDDCQFNVSRKDVIATNNLFEKLTVPENFLKEGEFAKWWREVEPEPNEAFFDKLARFMGTFFEAIQLDSDTSRNAAKTLNEDEISTLKNIISFSGMVAVEEKSEQAEHSGVDNIRRLNRELIKTCLPEIQTRYEEPLRQLSSIISPFSLYQPRFGERELCVSAYSSIIPSNEIPEFAIRLEIDAGSRQSSSVGKKYIWHFLTCSSENFKQWLEEYLQDLVHFEESSGENEYVFWEQEFSPETPIEEVHNTFRESAFKVLDDLLPRLAQLHEEGKL